MKEMFKFISILIFIMIATVGMGFNNNAAITYCFLMIYYINTFDKGL